ncbi:MAG: gamma carbonic anhydrase family protein [Elusimicrobia bacterium]|nr:gamma carbonic anhydrase family protein [Elusimicrobiota bacterium]
MIRSFEKSRPKIADGVFVHDTAEVIGAVSVAKGASLWPYCVLRGDVDRVVVGERSNIQDFTMIHCREGKPTVVGRGVTVGHHVTLHGCRIGDLCLIGMGSKVMEATIGRECLVAAGALVLAGLRIPPRSLVMGSPARVVRRLKPEELASLRRSADSYVRLAGRHARTSKVVFR